MNRVIWLTIASLVLTLSTSNLGCSKDGADSSDFRGQDSIAANEAAGGAQGTVASSDRAETVTVHMSLVVEEVREAMSSLRDLVSRHQGYVQQADFVDGGNRRAGLVARVPANELAAFREAFTDLGEVSSEPRGRRRVGRTSGYRGPSSKRPRPRETSARTPLVSNRIASRRARRRGGALSGA